MTAPTMTVRRRRGDATIIAIPAMPAPPVITTVTIMPGSSASSTTSTATTISYCRDRQDRFESDFGDWRENRMNKRQQLGGIREHMDVVGNDGETIGKVDKVRGDHVVLTKSDSEDNRHHAIDCSMIETIEGNQVRLDVSADEAKSRWEDAENTGAFFGATATATRTPTSIAASRGRTKAKHRQPDS